MAASRILLAFAAAAVAICSNFVGAHPILPFGKILPHIRPIFPPLIPPIAPIIPPIAPIAPIHPIMPILPPVHPIRLFRRQLFPRRRIMSGPRYIPKSRPFVLEKPSISPRRQEPVSINLIDGRDNNRDIIIVTIDDKRPQTREIIQPQIIRTTDDQGYSGDISVDGNVYIGADAGVRAALDNGASVEKIVGSAIRSGLSTNDQFTTEYDYPLPQGPGATVVADNTAVNTAVTTV